MCKNCGHSIEHHNMKVYGFCELPNCYCDNYYEEE